MTSDERTEREVEVARRSMSTCAAEEVERVDAGDPVRPAGEVDVVG